MKSTTLPFSRRVAKHWFRVAGKAFESGNNTRGERAFSMYVKYQTMRAGS